MPAENNCAVRLSQLARRLDADGWQPPRDYRVLWQAALNGDIPAEQLNGRWHFRPHNVPAIARALRLRRRPGPRSGQPASQSSVVTA